MSAIPFAIVGFDLDGTLIDTSEDLRAAANHALALGDMAPLSPSQIRSAIGGGARLMLARGIEAAGVPPLAPERFERLFDAFLTYYAANIAVHSRPFPGALAALDRLAELGVRVGIVTNKREHYARLLFDALGLTQRFDAIIGGDTLAVAKPDPAPIHAMIEACAGSLPSRGSLQTLHQRRGSRAAFVGDSHFDIDAAHAAGIPAAACRFGFLMRPVETLGADAIIDHFDDLLPALQRLTPRLTP
jgi:phosphoglycolate phosphatase